MLISQKAEDFAVVGCSSPTASLPSLVFLEAPPLVGVITFNCSKGNSSEPEACLAASQLLVKRRNNGFAAQFAEAIIERTSE